MTIEHLLSGLTNQRAAFKAARSVFAPKFAPDFNVFDFIMPDELRLSRIIAWLLNPEGNHGQGTVFLRELLHHLALTWPLDVLSGAQVTLEDPTYEGRRVDITIRMPGAVLCIENKPFAADAPMQIADYLTWMDLIGSGSKRCMVYIAGQEGKFPVCGSISASQLAARREVNQFYSTNYPELLPWLERSRELCAAESVRSFLDGLIGYIRKRFSGAENVMEREHLVQIATKSSDNLRSALQVASARDDIKSAVIVQIRDQIVAALPAGYVLSNFQISNEKYTELWIEMPDVLEVLFSVSFQASNYRYLIYGVRRRKDSEGSNEVQSCLASKFGPGIATQDWPWYRRAALNEGIFPVEGNWDLREQPWLDAYSGKFAQIIVEAAKSFREALIVPMI